MNLDRAVISFAGIMVLVSLALTHLFGPYWLLLTVFIGLNLLQAGFSGFCPAAFIFKKFGIRPGTAFR
jgi:Inner membrane protein YgaP-like, transmembrane domain